MTRGKVTGWNCFWVKAQRQRSSVIRVRLKGGVHVLRRRPRARAEPDAVHRRSGQVDQLIVRNRGRNSPVACEFFGLFFVVFFLLFCTSPVSYFQSTVSQICPWMKRKHLSPLLSNKVKQESAADSGRLSNTFVKVSFLPQMNGKWNICVTFALFSLFSRSHN